MTDPDLIRFLDAQDLIYQQVFNEPAAGRKETHWMWFIFPQLAGLGRGGMAQQYAIRHLDQAKRYLADSILGPRLRRVVELLIAQKRKSAFEILGSPDDLKLGSCLTLFREAAIRESDRILFGAAIHPHHPGRFRSLCAPGVRHKGWNDDSVVRTNDTAFVTELHPDPAFKHYDCLFYLVHMKRHRSARVGPIHEQANRACAEVLVREKSSMDTRPH